MIVTANDSPHNGGHDDLLSFSNNIVFGRENEDQSSKTYGLYDRHSSSNCPCRRYYSTVQPLYEPFRVPNPSPMSIFLKILTFRHYGCMYQGCWSIHSSSCGPRRALILGEDQAMTHWSCLILRDFHLRRLGENQEPEKTENASSAQATFVEQSSLSRYYSSV